MDLLGFVKSASRYQVPYSCFVTLEIGDIILGNELAIAKSRDPQAITSFKITRLNMNGFSDKTGTIDKDKISEIDENNEAERFITNEVLFSKAEFGLSTIQDIKLEKRLLDFINTTNNQEEVHFRYGFVNGLRSYKYSGIISKLQMSSDMYTMHLVVSGTGLLPKYSTFTADERKSVFGDNNTKINEPGKKIKISEIIRKIAEVKKWKIGEIVETPEIDSSSIPVPNPADTPLKYINNLRVFANSNENKTGGGRYRSVFKFDKDGEVKYYFSPSQSLLNGSYEVRKDYNFYYNLLPSGEVVEFNPVLTNYISYINESNNNNKKNNESNKKEASNIFGVITSDTKEIQQVEVKAKDKQKPPGILNSTGKVVSAAVKSFALNAKYSDVEKYTKSVVLDDISSYVFNTAMNPRASMKIIGDPRLRVLDYINVIPMYPAKSRLSGGIMHPSGGTYRITHIVDTISGGMYYTSLDMYKFDNTVELSVITGKNVGK